MDVYNLMQKPRLVITKAALEELQARVLAQYHHGNKHYKYNSIMNHYNTLVTQSAEDTVVKPVYVLAE